MKAVITGDIIKSRSRPAVKWQAILKKILLQYGKEPGDWELFRGDSFQLALKPEDGLLASIHIKAGIKQLSDLDVRLGLGIGKQSGKTKKITEATGPAFIRSGESFDNLKKQTLAIATGNKSLDEVLNLMLILASLAMDNWTPTVASVIVTSLEHPENSQQEIARKMKKSQSNISEALKRGGFEEVKKMEAYYRNEINKL